MRTAIGLTASLFDGEVRQCSILEGPGFLSEDGGVHLSVVAEPTQIGVPAQTEHIRSFANFLPDDGQNTEALVSMTGILRAGRQESPAELHPANARWFLRALTVG